MLTRTLCSVPQYTAFHAKVRISPSGGGSGKMVCVRLTYVYFLGSASACRKAISRRMWVFVSHAIGGTCHRDGSLRWRCLFGIRWKEEWVGMNGLGGCMWVVVVMSGLEACTRLVEPC